MNLSIKDIADVINISVSNPSESGYDVFVGLEHYDIGEPVITRYGSTQMLTTACKKFQSGDILLARRNVYLRRAGLVEFEGLTSGDSIVIRVKNNISIEGIDTIAIKRLLPFILNTNAFWDYANTNSDGTMSKRLSPQMLLDYEFDIPEASEQKSLADKLWSAYKLKAATLILVSAIDEMVKSQFIEMFANKGYPKQTLNSFAEITTGSTPSKKEPKYWENGDKPWVSAQDMKDKYVFSTEEKLTDVGFAKCKILPIDTLMYVCRGSIGVMAINKIACATNQSICTATCNENKCNVEFLYHSLLYQKDSVKSIGEGTSFKSLSQSTFANIAIDLPPMEEQMKFVAIAKQADKSKFELKKSIEKIDNVMKALMQ